MNKSLSVGRNKSQHKVATLTVSYIQKIKDYLLTTPEGATPKMIALYTGIKHSYVRTLLPKIPEIKADENIRGLYHLVVNPTHGDIFAYNFHNLFLVIYLPNYSGETIETTLSCEFTNYKLLIAKTTKQATLNISTPDINGTDYPINISSITLAFALFKSLIKQHTNTDIDMKDVEVRSIEFNKDFSNLKLEGVNCITLSNLLEQCKIYNKTDKLRLEHKIIVPMDANTLINLLGIDLKGGLEK